MLHAPGHNTEAAPQQPLQLPALLDARDLAEAMATLLRRHSRTPGQEAPRIRTVRQGEAVQSLADYDPPAPVFFLPLADGTVRQQNDYTPLVDHEVLQLSLVLSRAARQAANGDMQAAHGLLTPRIRQWAARFLHLARPRVVHAKGQEGDAAYEPPVYAQLSQLLHDTLPTDAIPQPTAAQRAGLVRPASAPVAASQLQSAADTISAAPGAELVMQSFRHMADGYATAIRTILDIHKAKAAPRPGIDDAHIVSTPPEQLTASADVCAGLQSAAVALAAALDKELANVSFGTATVPAPLAPSGDKTVTEVFGHYTNEVGGMLAVMDKYQLSPSKSKEVSVLMARWTQARQAAAALALLQGPAGQLQPAHAAHFATQLATYQRPAANPFLESEAPHTNSAAVKHLFHTANHFWKVLFIPGYAKLPDTRPQPAAPAAASARQPAPFIVASSTGGVVQAPPRPAAAPQPAPAPRPAARSMVPPLRAQRGGPADAQRRSA